jgi:hypothetical protein
MMINHSGTSFKDKKIEYSLFTQTLFWNLSVSITVQSREFRLIHDMQSKACEF